MNEGVDITNKVKNKRNKKVNIILNELIVIMKY
jgi:hypothetical protein